MFYFLYVAHYSIVHDAGSSYRCDHTFSLARFERVIINVGNSTNCAPFRTEWPTISTMNIASIFLCLAACFFFCSFAFRYDDRTILRYCCTIKFHFLQGRHSGNRLSSLALKEAISVWHTKARFQIFLPTEKTTYSSPKHPKRSFSAMI